MPVANGRWSCALAAVLGPAMLVRYLRTQPLARAVAGGLVVMSVAEFFWWKGILPLSGISSGVASVAFGVVNLIPYLLDRTIAPRIRSFTSTLVLPLIMVGHEALTERFSPFGSWASFAYTQGNILPVAQLASITGLAGITFLVLWSASVINWLWEGRATRAGVLAYATVVIAVFAFGIVRLMRAPEAASTLRVAAITPAVPTYTAMNIRRAMAPAQRESFAQRAAAIQQELLDASEREARKGAQLIVWSEGAAIADAKDEAQLIARAAAVAQRTRSLIALSFLTLGSAFENKTVLVDEAGKALWTYRKAHPVPGMEDRLRPGDAQLPLARKMSTAICFDADFPSLVRQANDADVLIVPADDWPAIASLHAQMAKFRAIERGFSVIRSTSSGRSVAYDRYGRTLASADYFAGARVMTASLPLR